MRPSPVLTALIAALALAACASLGQPARTPAPAVAVDPARLFTGTWYEIGRTPARITDGCVAGGSTYSNLSGTRLSVLDFCRQGGPGGKLRTIGGPGRLIDPHWMSVRYLWVLRRDYQVLDHDPDYSWFISADPAFENLWIYTREPRPSAILVGQITARAKALGYDVSRLEFPTQASTP